MDLEGRKIVITGGGGTLGLVIAEQLASRGAELMLWCHSRGRDAVDALKCAGYHAEFVNGDVSDERATAAAARSIGERWDRVDGVVNNAATMSGFSPLTEVTVEKFDYPWAVNVRGAWLVARDLMPLLQNSAAARIVHMGSDTTRLGSPFAISHVASKSALEGLTRGMASELGMQGMTVNLVVPGLFDTPVAREKAPAHVWDAMRDRQALKDRNNLPQDIAPSVAFLQSDAAARITGQTLFVNAGAYFG